MQTRDNRKGFSAVHHALLYAWLSKAVIHHCGEEDGALLMRQAVREYGYQRGHRMALRAEQNGDDLSMANYLVYGEWKVPKGEMEQRILEKSPDVRACILKCPWYETWKKHDLVSYGKSYCQEVDDALVKGFNQNLGLTINSIQSLGDSCCEFVFQGANLKSFNLLAYLYKKIISPGRRAVMDWEYHCGHLFKSVRDVVVTNLGQIGEGVVEIALNEFTKHYGEDRTDCLKAALRVDFESLPAS